MELSQDPQKRPTIRVLQDAEAVDSIDHYTKLVESELDESTSLRLPLRIPLSNQFKEHRTCAIEELAQFGLVVSCGSRRKQVLDKFRI